MSGRPPDFCGDTSRGVGVASSKINKEVLSMDEETKKKVAVFRFGVIHDLVGGIRLSRGEKEALIREKSSHEWDIPCVIPK